MQAHTARGRLRDRHQQLLRSKLAQLKAEQLGKKVEDVKPGPSRIQEEDKKERVPRHVSFNFTIVNTQIYYFYYLQSDFFLFVKLNTFLLAAAINPLSLPQ